MTTTPEISNQQTLSSGGSLMEHIGPDALADYLNSQPESGGYYNDSPLWASQNERLQSETNTQLGHEYEYNDPFDHYLYNIDTQNTWVN